MRPADLNLTANLCPDCGIALLADDEDFDDVKFACPGCGSKFDGELDHGGYVIHQEAV